jgi:antitoxin (DNA-binding transcriptional repressor) of toxin-antitoxin stability system
MAFTTTVRELRNHFPRVRRLLEEEGEVVVTDNGTPKYRLSKLAQTPPASPPLKDYVARMGRHQPRPLTAAAAKALGCLAAFRKAIGADAMRDALASFDEDIADGRYNPIDVLWRATLKRAADLGRAHTAALGCRSLDVLHVATALELKVPIFVTYDARHPRLARAAGLRVLTPKP